MRALLAIPFLLLALTPFAVAKDVPLPAIPEGATWTYATTLTGPAGGSTTANATVTVASDNVTVGGGSTFAAYRFRAVYDGARQGETETIWYAKETMSKLRHARTSESGPTDYTAQAPCAEWQFPMSVGKTWSSTCTLQSGADTFTYSAAWKVLREETVQVPAGSFAALVVEENDTDGARSLYWFAPDACSYVQMQSFAPNGAMVESHRLATRTCTPTSAPVGTTPASSTPASSTPPSSTPPSSTPASSTPASTGGATTPAGSTPSGTSPASSTPENDTILDEPATRTPGPGVAVALVAVGAAAVLLGSRKLRR